MNSVKWDSGSLVDSMPHYTRVPLRSLTLSLLTVNVLYSVAYLQIVGKKVVW